MSSSVQQFLEKRKNALREEKQQKKMPDVRTGDIVRVWTKVSEAGKERLTPFEGVVISRKHGNEMGGTITVRTEISGYGVERIFPVHAPTVARIERLKSTKVRRSKLYYLRGRTGRRARMRVREVLGPDEDEMEDEMPDRQENQQEATGKQATQEQTDNEEAEYVEQPRKQQEEDANKDVENEQSSGDDTDKESKVAEEQNQKT